MREKVKCSKIFIKMEKNKFQGIKDKCFKLFSGSFEKNLGSFVFKFDFWIFLIILLGILVNFYGLAQRGVWQWDEGDYLTGAKRVLQGDIRKLGVGFKFVHNLINVIFFALFGAKDYVGFASSAVFGLLTIYLVYLIGDKLFGRKTALLAALILTVTEYFIYFSRSAMSDGHLAFFFTLTIFVYIHGLFEKNKFNLLLTGFLAGVCYATKNTGALVIPLIFLLEFIFLVAKKQDWKTTLYRIIVISIPSFLIIFSLVLAINLLSKHKEIAQYKTTARIYDIFFRMGEGADFYYYLYGLFKLSSIFTMGLLLLGLIRSLKEGKESDWIIFMWFIFLYVFFSAFPQHRFKLFSIVLPAVALLSARGLDWFKKNYIVASLMVFLIVSSFFNAYNTITGSNLAYKKAAEIIIKDRGKGVVASDVGKIRFYVSDLPLETIGFDKSYDSENNVTLESLKRLQLKGYTHIVFDWRAGRIAPELGWSKVRNFRDQVIKEVQPVAVIRNNNFKVDEFSILKFNLVKRMKHEEVEEYKRWQDKSYRGTHSLSEEEIVYNDSFRYFSSYYFLKEDTHSEFIYVYRISDLILEIQDGKFLIEVGS